MALTGTDADGCDAESSVEMSPLPQLERADQAIRVPQEETHRKEVIRIAARPRRLAIPLAAFLLVCCASVVGRAASGWHHVSLAFYVETAATATLMTGMFEWSRCREFKHSKDQEQAK